MEVALLTATLAAEVARFETNLASADRMIANTREGLRGLERDALAANLALKSVGGPAGDAAAKLREVRFGSGQSATMVAEAGTMTSAVNRIADAGRSATDAVKDIEPSATAIPRLAAVKAEVEGIRDAAFEADAATRLIGGGGGRSLFRGYSEFGMIGGPRTLTSYSDRGRAGLLGFLLGARGGDGGGGDVIARDVAAAAGGGGGGPGGGGGFFSGILPGGRRAGAGAVTTAIGLGIAASPALIPAAGGLATAAAAGMTTLIGAAGTLKLAFADLTSAAFTTQRAFDQLTPIQQRFVTTLRSLDAGLLKGNLEPLAQRTLLPQLTAAIHAAFTPAAVSSLQRGVAGFSNAIGGGAQQLGALFGSSGFQAQFGTMLQQDAGYLRSFLDGLTHLIDAFVRIQVAAGPFLTWLSNAATNLAKWVDNAIKADQANGRLAGFFSEAKTALEALGNLVGSIAGALHSLVAAFGGFSTAISVINTLSRIFGMIGSLLNANRTVLRDFFAGALQAANAILTVVGKLLSYLAPVLSLINQLIHGTTGWRIVIEALTAGWIAFTIAMNISSPLVIITGITLALGFLLTHWKQLTQAMPVLWKAAWDAIKGILNLAIFELLAGFELLLKGLKAALGWIPGIGGAIKHGLDQAIGFIQQFQARGIKDLANAGDLAGQAWGIMFNARVSEALRVHGAAVDPQARNIQARINQDAVLPVGPGMSPPEALTLAQAARAQRQRGAFGTPGALQQAGTSGAGLLPQSMQQAIANQQIVVAQQTAGTAAQRQALQGLIADYQKASEWLAKQHGTQLQMTAIDKERATLAKEIASAQHQIATSLDQQFRTTLAVHQQALSQAMATFATGIGQGTTPQQQLAAANALIKVADTQRRQLDTLLSQATTEKERLAVQRELLAVEKDIARARRVQATARLTEQDLRTLGIAGTPGAPGLQSLRTREREILLQEIARFARPAGRGGAHLTAEQAAAQLIPDAVTAPLDRLIKEMQAAGITIPKSTLDSLHKINEVLNRHEKLGAKLNDLVSQNVTGRLTQINDTLKSLLGTGLSNYRVPTEKDLTAGLTGLTPGQRKQIGERLAEVAELHGKIPGGPAALGIPLGPGGQTLTSGPVTVVHVHGGITVSIPPEAARNPRRIAEEIRHELLKTARRNPTQTRGPNAGRNVGMN